jgi:hypothetical protein
MTAHDFIAQLFGRVQTGVASNMRYVTAPQFDLLEKLIGQDEEGGAVRRGINGSFTWMPSGRWKYVLSNDPGSGRRSIMRLMSPTPTGAGRLFT